MREEIEFVCNKLNLSDNVITKSMEILNKIGIKNLFEKNELGFTPKVIVCSTVYIASMLCKESRTQQDIFFATGIRSGSISRCYKIIRENYMNADFKMNKLVI